jgi:hypothetical protein
MGIQTSGGEEELSPSNSIRRPNWFEMTLRDDQEQVEAPRSTFRESMPPKKFPNFVVLMNNVIENAVDQQVQHDDLVQDDVYDIMPRPEEKIVPGVSSRSNFLSKREC